MMQQVATSQSEIAVVATATSGELPVDTGNSESFGRMLQDHQQPNNGSDSTSSNNKADKHSSSKSDVDVATSKTESTANSKDNPKNIATLPDQQPEKIAETTDENQPLSENEINTADIKVAEEKVLSNNTISSSVDEFVVAEPSTKNVQIVAEVTDRETQVIDEPQNIESKEAQVWVTLVERLQQFKQNIAAEKTQTDVSSDVNDGVPHTDKTEKVSDDYVVLKGSDQSPLENSIQQLLTSALKQLDGNKKIPEGTVSEANQNDDIASKLIANPEILQQVFKQLVQQTQGDVLSSEKLIAPETLSDEALALIASIILPSEAENIQNNSKVVDENRLVVEEMGKELSDTILPNDGAIKPQNDSDELIKTAAIDVESTSDLAIPASQKKLEPENKVEQKPQSINEVAQSNIEEVESRSHIDAIAKETASAEIKSQPSQLDLDSVTNINIAAEEFSLLANSATELEVKEVEDFKMVEETTAKIDPSAVQVLASISPSKLDKVIPQIVQHLFVQEPNSGMSQTETESLMNKMALEVHGAENAPIKEFVAALKSGVAEFKSQSAQGREPGLDLKSLITEAVNKVNAEQPKLALPENMDKVVNNLTQVLEFASGVNRSIEQYAPNQSSVYSATLREASQIQGEQTKQLQFNQAEQKFEKAVNIAKPEGLAQLAEKVRWMANVKNLVAEIRLDPAELGSVHVKVAMSGDSATVNFVVQSQHARDAMDNATPRLREMLAEKGIELGQSSVRQESKESGQGQDEQLARDTDTASTENTEDESENQQDIQQRVVNGALGGIDYFA